jgi:thioredoxin reductase
MVADRRGARHSAGMTWDSVIIGAGPAGLSAAQVLGRARRSVLVLDSGRPRNDAAQAMHGVLGHDGLAPADLRARGRAEIARYGVTVRDEPAGELRLDDDGVRVGDELARTVVLATGLLDALPELPGFDAVWGTSAHVCPYCDGWEHRDERIAVYAPGEHGDHLARLLRQWSPDVMLLTDGGDAVDAAVLDGIPVVRDPVEGLESDGSRLTAVRLADGRTLERDALFFFIGLRPRTELAAQLGCELREDGSIVAGEDQHTSVDGVYAAGNCANTFAGIPVAAAEGVKAAVAINTRLTGLG